MRHIFSSFGGNLGETGSVSGFAFDYRGMIQIERPTDIDAFELVLLETNALDYTIGELYVDIVTDRSEFTSVRSVLVSAGYPIISSQIGYIPRSYIEVTDPDTALRIYKILEDLDTDEDVECVYNTADIADTLWEQCREKVAASRFKT
jgi:transcriptional/translational regulatory protein YebC/TACO1